MQEFINRFTEFFGFKPTVFAQAPGRLELLGNHTDYNEGFVLSCAVSQNIRFALAPVAGNECRVVDFRDGHVMKFTLDQLDAPPPRNGSRYIIGMMRQLRDRGCRLGAFCGALQSSVPLGAGMSSSAALEISCGLAIGGEFGIELSKPEWARAGQGVENDYLGLKTGLLDQFSSLFGQKDHIIMSDFRTVEVINTMPLPPGYVFVVINSMKKHHLVDSDYNVRRQDCESAAAKLSAVYPGVKTLRDVSMKQLDDAKNSLSQREYSRARHVVGECERVKLALDLLNNGEVGKFGQLLFDSHESSRVNFENSTPELDYLVELAHSIPGCLGARLSGGGFGGITIHLVKADDAAQYASRVCAAYKLKTGIDAESFICELGAGASAMAVR